MSKALTFQCEFHLAPGRRGRKRLRPGKEPRRATTVLAGRIPRVARLMALAIHFNELIVRGELEDFSELARLGHVTPPRISQIMSLLQLAPDIQEALLFLPRTVKGRDPVMERQIYPVVASLDWGSQRRAWSRVVGHTDSVR